MRSRDKNKYHRVIEMKLQPLGKGRQGIAFLIKRKRPYVVKVVPYDIRAGSRQPANIEFTIQKIAYKAAPKGVVKVIKLEKKLNFIKPSVINMPNVQNSRNFNKSRQSVIYMEYCAGGDLETWIKKRRRLSEATLMRAIKNILGTLIKIQKVYPDFRHNDLHAANVFVAKRGFLIGDFGWARLQKTGTNPAVNNANGTTTAQQWGVGPHTDPRYDYHLFLNRLGILLFNTRNTTKFPRVYKLISSILPPGYRGETDVHISESRLKYGDPCPGLPSLEEAYKMVGGNRVNRMNRRRPKIIGPTGRLVYADGSSITLKYLKNLAKRKNISIRGLRTKRQLVSKIFRL